ncbi:hypothetical protein BCR37DRAFT_379277 [Protomyces lactucae-debilis]|uniref:Uncharacterized protein n=1 Tax=Protomyces lactucae-debilis TaxID=2754530 RepID=A0A1Y2FIP4_PROLT|nr:uncharacterized protein BCR37DRAFT_379277 [Protomyces lactucae-debilis]ORY83254.1 hypothetical protein BCR37DRAFT_379277 [Protomyces lactucae-debilis]
MPSASFRHELGLGDEEEEEDDGQSYSDEEDEDYPPTTPRAKQHFGRGTLPLSPPDSTRRSAYPYSDRADMHTRTYDASTSGQLYHMSKITDVYASSLKSGNSYSELDMHGNDALYTPSESRSGLDSGSEYLGYAQDMSRQGSASDPYFNGGQYAAHWDEPQVRHSQHWEEACQQLQQATGLTPLQPPPLQSRQPFPGLPGLLHSRGSQQLSSPGQQYSPMTASSHTFTSTPLSGYPSEVSPAMHSGDGRFSPHTDFGGPLDLMQGPPVPPIGPPSQRSKYAHNLSLTGPEGEALQRYQHQLQGEHGPGPAGSDRPDQQRARAQSWHSRRGHRSD